MFSRPFDPEKKETGYIDNKGDIYVFKIALRLFNGDMIATDEFETALRGFDLNIIFY